MKGAITECVSSYNRNWDLETVCRKAISRIIVIRLYILKKIDFQQIFKARRRKTIAKFHGLKRFPFKDNEKIVALEIRPIRFQGFKIKVRQGTVY